jgi:hypothetical protein
MLNVVYAECHIKATCAECCYAECRYAECRYAECRGAKDRGLVQNSQSVKSITMQ